MRLPPSRRRDYRHFTTHSTRWSDNDVYGHMNNVIHYQLFDSTVNEWLIRGNLLAPRLSSAIALVAETGCRYHSELTYPQRVTAGLRVSKIGGSSVRYEIALFGDDKEEAAAEGFFIHVYVDAQTHKPCPIPAATRDALDALLAVSPKE